MGQTSKLLAAGYVSNEAGGPKQAYFSKESQDKLHDFQDVRAAHSMNTQPWHSNSCVSLVTILLEVSNLVAKCQKHALLFLSLFHACENCYCALFVMAKCTLDRNGRRS